MIPRFRPGKRCMGTRQALGYFLRMSRLAIMRAKEGLTVSSAQRRIMNAWSLDALQLKALAFWKEMPLRRRSPSMRFLWPLSFQASYLALLCAIWQAAYLDAFSRVGGSIFSRFRMLVSWTR